MNKYFDAPLALVIGLLLGVVMGLTPKEAVVIYFLVLLLMKFDRLLTALSDTLNSMKGGKNESKH